MKEDNKSNPQYTNPNFDGNLERLQDDPHKEVSAAGRMKEDNLGKRLEDRPGAFLLKETSADQEASLAANKTTVERSDLEEEITREDEIDDMFSDGEFY